MKELNAELYKLLHKKGFYYGFLLTIIWSALMIVVFKTSLERTGIEYNASTWAQGFADMLSTYLVWILIVFAYIIVSTDYVEKTVSNLIIAGGNRIKIYLSKVFLFLTSAILVVIISCTTITLVSGIIFGWGDWNAEYTRKFIDIVLKLIVYVVQYVAYFSLLCSIFRNQAGCLISSFLTLMALSIVVQVLKMIFKNAEGIEEMAPCVAGNIIGSYGEQYVARWIVLCVVSFIVVTLVGAFLARKREF